MNVSTKTMPWMVASLLAVTSIFGQSQNQNQGGCAPQPNVCKPVPPPRCGPLQAPQQPMNCAYNAPAEVNIGMQGDIDFFAAGSFLYWQASQDNMAVGLTTNVPINVGVGVALEPTIQGSFIDMNFKYQPGFKVGLGMNLQMDDWDGYVEYTRVHGDHTTSSSGPLASQLLHLFSLHGGIPSSWAPGWAENFSTLFPQVTEITWTSAMLRWAGPIT